MDESNSLSGATLKVNVNGFRRSCSPLSRFVSNRKRLSAAAAAAAFAEVGRVDEELGFSILFFAYAYSKKPVVSFADTGSSLKRSIHYWQRRENV